MNCYLHPEVAAVAVCVHCGKAMCSDCARDYKGQVCVHCAKRVGNRIAAQYIFHLALYAVLFVVGYKLDFLATPEDGSRPIFSGYVLMAIVSGWQFINKIVRFSLFGTIAAWTIYWLIKLVVSAFVGFFTAPFTILWNVYRVATSLKIK